MVEMQLQKVSNINVDFGGISSSKIINLINQSQRVMYKLLSTCLSHHGLNIAQWMVLGELNESPKSPTQVARELDIKTAYVALLVKQLRSMGDIITESANDNDSRSKIIKLSPAGYDFFAQVESKIQVCLKRDLAQKIAPDDLETYLSVTDFITKKVTHGGM